jgi:hypothetical protein
LAIGIPGAGRRPFQNLKEKFFPLPFQKNARSMDFSFCVALSLFVFVFLTKKPAKKTKNF